MFPTPKCFTGVPQDACADCCLHKILAPMFLTVYSIQLLLKHSQLPGVGVQNTAVGRAAAALSHQDVAFRLDARQHAKLGLPRQLILRRWPFTTLHPLMRFSLRASFARESDLV